MSIPRRLKKVRISHNIDDRIPDIIDNVEDIVLAKGNILIIHGVDDKFEYIFNSHNWKAVFVENQE